MDKGAFLMVWKDAQGFFKTLHLAMFVGSLIALCVWLSWCMRAKDEMIRNSQCEQLFPGSEEVMSLEIHLIAVSVGLVMAGYVLSWFDELFLEDNTMLESRVVLSTFLRVVIQASELCSVFNLLFTLHMDRSNAFNYRQ